MLHHWVLKDSKNSWTGIKRKGIEAGMPLHMIRKFTYSPSTAASSIPCLCHHTVQCSGTWFPTPSTCLTTFMVSRTLCLPTQQARSDRKLMHSVMVDKYSNSWFFCSSDQTILPGSRAGLNPNSGGLIGNLTFIDCFLFLVSLLHILSSISISQINFPNLFFGSGSASGEIQT